MLIKVVILSALVLFLGACSNELTSNYEFPEHEFTRIHQHIVRAYNAGEGWRHWSSYTSLDMLDLDSRELMEIISFMFEDIVDEAIEPFSSPYRNVLDFYGNEVGLNVIPIIHQVPAMEVLDICILREEGERGDCLWENWGILSDAQVALGRTHP